MRFLLENTEWAGNAFFFRGVRRLVRRRVSGGGFRLKLSQRRLAHDRAPFHAAVLLGSREWVGARDLGEADPAVEAGCLGASDRERVEPDTRADATRVLPAI